MTYELYRLDHPDLPPTGSRLAAYADFDTALAARDCDVITQLTEQPAPPREIAHLIVGPGLRGPHTEHPIVTFAGTDITDPGLAAEVAAVAVWLTAVRAT